MYLYERMSANGQMVPVGTEAQRSHVLLRLHQGGIQGIESILGLSLKNSNSMIGCESNQFIVCADTDRCDIKGQFQNNLALDGIPSGKSRVMYDVPASVLHLSLLMA